MKRRKRKSKLIATWSLSFVQMIKFINDMSDECNPTDIIFHKKLKFSNYVVFTNLRTSKKYKVFDSSYWWIIDPRNKIIDDFISGHISVFEAKHALDKIESLKAFW